jgi:hypothetical protein
MALVTFVEVWKSPFALSLCCVVFTLTSTMQIAADKAQVSAEELRDRQSKFWVQEQGYVDDAKRLAAAEWWQAEEREQAVPVVASFPRVETRQMKKARLS